MYCHYGILLEHCNSEIACFPKILVLPKALKFQIQNTDSKIMSLNYMCRYDRIFDA